MNKNKIKHYLIAVSVIFMITYLIVSFIIASFTLPQGSRFGVVAGTVFFTFIYALIIENPQL